MHVKRKSRADALFEKKENFFLFPFRYSIDGDPSLEARPTYVPTYRVHMEKIKEISVPILSAKSNQIQSNLARARFSTRVETRRGNNYHT